MDQKKIANLCLLGGILVLALASLLRIGVVMAGNMVPNIPDLWKLSMALFLASIAASLKRD
jgi:hypothetical protein